MQNVFHPSFSNSVFTLALITEPARFSSRSVNKVKASLGLTVGLAPESTVIFGLPSV